MHPTTFLALTLAPLAALSLPIILPPIVLASLEAIPFEAKQAPAPVTGPHHPPAYVALAAQRPLLRPFFSTPAAPPTNAPVTPAASADADEALAAPRPLSTNYLLSLAQRLESYRGKLSSTAVAAAEHQKKQHAAAIPTAIAQLETGIVVVQADRVATTATAGSLAVGVPCRYARRVARQQNDALVVCLVLAFFVIVVAVELGGNVCARFGGKGAIRLEDAEEQRDEKEAVRTPLSVRANEVRVENAAREECQAAAHLLKEHVVAGEKAES